MRGGRIAFLPQAGINANELTVILIGKRIAKLAYSESYMPK
jgi:hypothetical protein